MKGCVDSVILTDVHPCLNFIKYLQRYWYDKWPKNRFYSIQNYDTEFTGWQNILISL